jgi:hypothetical protein
MRQKGNDAHGGNIDATLYSPAGGRTDLAVFQKLYGVHPFIIPSTGKSTNGLFRIGETDIDR